MKSTNNGMAAYRLPRILTFSHLVNKSSISNVCRTYMHWAAPKLGWELVGNLRFQSTRLYRTIPTFPHLELCDIIYLSEPYLFQGNLEVEVGPDGRPIVYISPPGSPSGDTGKPQDDRDEGNTPQTTPSPQPVSSQRSHICA